MKSGKAAGFNGLSNEFFIYGNSMVLVDILHTMYSMMMKTATLPTGFNTALLIPIPKSKEISAPADYRPISVSTPLCTILELLLKQRMSFFEEQHSNQFGYKKATSSKSPYFVVNETMCHYKYRRSNCHVISLDAVKAFDKLWRDGLFYKLVPKTEAGVWILLHRYYEESYTIVSVEGFRSDAFKINEDVKQGWILSSFLFNFFMDALLSRLLSMEIGALVGDVNTSALSYCDDILLVASNEGQMQMLVNCCADYAEQWKVSFNPLKSSCYSIKPVDYELTLNGGCIPDRSHE